MINSFKIGVWYYEDSHYSDGGAFSYTKIIQNLLLNNKITDDIEIVSIGFDIDEKVITGPKLSLKPIYKNIFWKWASSISLRLPFGKKLSSKIHKKYTNKLIDEIKRNDIQFIYYIKPSVVFLDFPHISTVWDSGHVSTYSFPETTMHGKLESRLKNAILNLNKSLIICCESEEGKKELQNYFSINPNKIEVVPMVASEVINPEITLHEVAILKNTDFFLYPAKYWPHKNHYNLIEAFSIFSKRYPNVKLVFTGFHQNNQEYINECIKMAGLDNTIIQLGVVSLSELKWLYTKAIAMIMPTLLGPTNMPLMEAYHLNCKVLCSNLPGHMEQLRDYAQYFDALDKYDIAEKIETCYLNRDKPAPNALFHSNEDALIALKKIFKKAMAIRKTWGKFDNIS